MVAPTNSSAVTMWQHNFMVKADKAARLKMVAPTNVPAVPKLSEEAINWVESTVQDVAYANGCEIQQADGTVAKVSATMIEGADLTPVTTPGQYHSHYTEQAYYTQKEFDASADRVTKRKDTPHPAVGMLLDEIEECRVSYPSSELFDMPNLEALNVLGDVCNREAEQLEESLRMEIDLEPQSNDGGLSSNLEQAIAAMAAESDAAKKASFTGENAGSVGQHKWLDKGKRIQPAPQSTTQAIAWCVCWLGCVSMLTPQDIEIGDDLRAQCRERHAKGIMICCKCECHGCSTMAARYKEGSCRECFPRSATKE